MKRGVIKVARRGFDVRYAKPKDMVIYSPANQLKRYLEQRGTLSIGPERSQASVIVTHNLGYRPFFFAYTKKVGEAMWQTTPGYYYVPAEGQNYSIYTAKTNAETESILTLYAASLFEPLTISIEVDYKLVLYIDPTRDV